MLYVALLVLIAVMLIPRAKLPTRRARLVSRLDEQQAATARANAAASLAHLVSAWHQRMEPDPYAFNVELVDGDSDCATTLPPPGRTRMAIVPPPPRVPHIEQYAEMLPPAYPRAA